MRKGVTRIADQGLQVGRVLSVVKGPTRYTYGRCMLHVILIHAPIENCTWMLALYRLFGGVAYIFSRLYIIQGHSRFQRLTGTTG